MSLKLLSSTFMRTYMYLKLMDEKPNEQQTNSSFKKLTTTKTISSPTSLSPSTATLKLKPSLLTPPTIDDYLPTDHPLLPSPTPSAKVLAQAASHSLDSTAENTFSPSSTSSSSFHPRATGYRHSFHRRHNSAKQRGHIGSNYPTYYNYRYDDSCSTDTIDKVETEIDQTLQLHAYDTPTSVLAARRLSKTPSPKPSNMYYDKQQRNSIFISGNNGYNNATSNSSRTSFTGCNIDEQQIQQTAQQLEQQQQQQQQQQQIVLQQHQQLQRNRSRSRSNTISRENSRKSCCSKRPTCNTNDINRRFSSTSSTTSQQLCCCDFDDEYDSDDVRCRSAGFCGSVCTKTFLITINLTFFVSILLFI
ncbi:hypothetical protein HELRODRAFT_160503 [Helobdella robusta]|uniref:Uncharacterized protein n=1 Tax=Helobdella robusta TaxID=6412 RepID=T1EQB9_HELRO|nr:hypothetical protein HELRODRAFT_160503 [Helobdella robusta]ESO06338.1 hypothetical protein HELRODRAFT_160503 [Helobdella robusta]